MRKQEGQRGGESGERGGKHERESEDESYVG